MFLKRAFYLMLAGLVMTFAACSNDDDDGDAFTEADLTIAAGWQLESGETNLDEVADDIGNAIPEEDLEPFGRDFFIALLIAAAVDLENVEDCEGDDVYTFIEGGSMDFDNGGTQCDPNADPEDDSAFVLPANWTLDGDMLTVTDGDGDVFSFRILTLNSTTLVIELRETFSEEDLNVSTDTEVVIRYTMKAAN